MSPNWNLPQDVSIEFHQQLGGFYPENVILAQNPAGGLAKSSFKNAVLMMFLVIDSRVFLMYCNFRSAYSPGMSGRSPDWDTLTNQGICIPSSRKDVYRRIISEF